MPRKKNTAVWENYFHSATNRIVKCKHCGKVYQFGNVSKMNSHLLKCYKCPTGIKNKLEKKSVTGITVKNLSMHDASQDDNLMDTTSIITTASGISTESNVYLDQLLSKAIFVTGAPLSIVEHPLWIQFFDHLQPLYKLPSTKDISTTHLETIYNEMVNEITNELKSINDLHLQCDGWSNQCNEGTINFIIAKPEPVFVKSINTLTNRHTSEHVSQEIIKVINVYGGHKFATIIGHNSNNIQRAFQIVKNSYAHIIPLRCVAHTLNLLCEDCLKLEPINKFMSIATDTIKAIKSDQSMSALLAQIIKEKSSSETLKLPRKSHWGTYCTALKSLKNSKVALQTLADHENANISEAIKTYLFNLNFWTMVETCIKLLEPITDQIFKLEGNGIHINEVYMVFKDIKSSFNFILPDISILNEHHKQDIINAVIRRISDCLKPIHYAAYLLDPRSQGNKLEEEHEVDAMEFIHEVSQSLNIDVGVDLANYRAKKGLWSRSFMWKHAAELDPVVWWRGFCRSKLLSRVATRILTAPCISIAAERSFSTQGHIHSHKRNRLTTDREAKIAFISYNWNLLHKHKDENNDDESLSTPKQLSGSLCYPIKEQPSTTRGNTQVIEFCNINNVFNDHNRSDSD